MKILLAGDMMKPALWFDGLTTNGVSFRDLTLRNSPFVVSLSNHTMGRHAKMPETVHQQPQ